MPQYSTSDLQVATCLKTIFHVLPEVRVKGRLCEFVFPIEPAQAEKVVQDYYNDRLTLPLRQFAADWRSLRALAADAKGAQGQ